MTDKHIKKGVDVSQCEYYSMGHDSCKHTISSSCVKENCQTFRLLQTIKAKEQECEELKKTIMYKCPQCGEEYLNPIGASLYEENNKLKQTLTDIKKIAEKDFNHTCWETYARQLKQILQKIS